MLAWLVYLYDKMDITEVSTSRERSRFDLVVLFYIDGLNNTRNLFFIKVHEVKKALIKDIGLVNRVHLTVNVR